MAHMFSYARNIARIAAAAVLAASMLTGCDVPSPEVQRCRDRAADYTSNPYNPDLRKQLYAYCDESGGDLPPWVGNWDD